MNFNFFILKFIVNFDRMISINIRLKKAGELINIFGG
jgi:hypothetical protein